MTVFFFFSVLKVPDITMAGEMFLGIKFLPSLTLCIPDYYPSYNSISITLLTIFGKYLPLGCAFDP